MSNYHRPDEERRSLDEIEESEQNELRQSKPKFNFFNRFYKDAEGVSKDEIAIADDPSFKNFFKLLGRKANQLLSANLLFLGANFPLIFLLLGMSGYLSLHTTKPIYPLFGAVRGAMLLSPSSSTAALWTLFSRQMDATVYTVWDYILFGLGALLIITFALSRVGITYILRNLFRGEPIFLLHDFFYAIKRNLRQGLIVGILDIAIFCGMFYGIAFYNLNYSLSMMYSIGFFTMLCLLVLYVLMRPYLYLMLITFDLKLFKLYKNAFLFTILGIKRNIAVLLGTLALLVLEYTLLIVYIPLGAILPFVILPSLLMMMSVYGAYPKIKEIMIDPYYSKASAEDSEEN